MQLDSNRSSLGPAVAWTSLVVLMTALASCGGGDGATYPSAPPTPTPAPTPYTSPPAGYDVMSSSYSEMIRFDRYIVLNNPWNQDKSPPGWWQQMFHQSGTSRWGSRWYWPEGGEGQWFVKSYPSIVCGWQWGLWSDDSGLGVRVGTPVLSRWHVTSSGRGRYNVTYDLWLHEVPHPTDERPTDEIMIWLAAFGGVAPAGDKQNSEPETLSGYNWDVYYSPGHGGGWDYIAFQSTVPLESVSLDLSRFTDYCVSRGWLSGREYVTSVEAGAEIWDGQDQLDTTEWSVTVP